MANSDRAAYAYSRYVDRYIGRPDDLSAYKLSKTREESWRENAEGSSGKMDFDDHGYMRFEQLDPILLKTQDELDPYPDEEETKIKPVQPFIPPEWTLKTVNLGNEDVKELAIFTGMMLWLSRAYGFTLSIPRAFVQIRAQAPRFMTPEGSFIPYWMTRAFWATARRQAFYGGFKLTVAREQRKFVYTSLFFGALYSFFQNSTDVPLAIDERLLPVFIALPFFITQSPMPPRYRWSISFALQTLAFSTGVFLMYSHSFGVPLKLGYRFRGNYADLMFLEESPEFYQKRNATALNNPYYLRSRRIGYTDHY